MTCDIPCDVDCDAACHAGHYPTHKKPHADRACDPVDLSIPSFERVSHFDSGLTDEQAASVMSSAGAHNQDGDDPVRIVRAVRVSEDGLDW